MSVYNTHQEVQQLQSKLAAKDKEIISLSESFDGIKNVLHDTQRELISVKSIAGKWQEKAMEWSRKNAELTNELQVNDQDRDLVANIIKSVPEKEGYVLVPILSLRIEC